ncbi:MAG: response regulator [Candidatus Poribacteria bacterium]|nr:response regulator [Candidatus Poribacteria bacterium]
MSRLPRILIVERNQASVDSLVAALQAEIAEVEFRGAASPERLQRALTEGVELVLTEYDLPWTTGIDLCAFLRSRHAHAPVVFYTDAGNEQVAVSAMKAGAEDYLPKSNDKSALIQAVRRALRNRRPVEQVARRGLLRSLISGVSDTIATTREEQFQREFKRVQPYLDLVDSIILVSDHEHHLIDANALANDTLEITDREMGNNWIDSIISPEARDAVYEELKSLGSALAFENVEYEAEAITPSGVRRTIRWATAPIRNAENELIGMMTTGDDITEQRRSRDELRHLFASTKCLMWRALVVRQDDGVFSWNLFPIDLQMAQQLIPLDVLPDEEFHDAWYRSKPLEDRERTDANSSRAFQEGLNVYSQDFRCIDKHGNLLWFNEDVTVKRLGEHRWEVVGVTTDITDRKRADAELELTTIRTQTILESVIDCIMTVDASGKVLDSNPASDRVFGVSPDQMKGQRIDRSLIFAEGTVEFADYVKTSINKRARLVGFRFGTDPFPAETTVTEMHTADETYFVVDVRDVSDEMEAEEALRLAMEQAETANRAKSEFLSRMSHELRTPMNSILGFAQLLDLSPNKDDVQARQVSQILKAGDHLLQLINEVLDLARIEAGRLSLSLEDVDLNEVVAEVFEMVRPLANERGIAVMNEMDGDETYYVFADRTRLSQVMVNLMANAIKYNRQNGSVSVDCVIDPNGRLRITVSDTGNGIPADKIERLFQPFDRLGAETTEVSGTGIGLTISRRLVEAMDGELTVQSAVGKGSRFSVILPMGERRESTEMAEPVAPVAELAEVLSSKFRILYVEDNPANLRLVENVLELRDDIELMSAPQASMGIELARAHLPDLILMDINLPGMDGYEALKLLLADARTARIPTIAVSANAMPRDVERGIAAGFRHYLTKPINVRVFLSVLDEFLT